MDKQTFVVEIECEACGGPCGEGIVNVREAKEGDEFGSRMIRNHEIPARWASAASSAHRDDAIVLYRRCDSCRYDY